MFYIIECIENKCDHLTYEEFYKDLYGYYSRNICLQIFKFRIIVKRYKNCKHAHTHARMHLPFNDFYMILKTLILKLKLPRSNYKIMHFSPCSYFIF